jgi:signal transduction histidine kinase
MVILVVWWPNFVLPVLLPLVRFTLGWYVGRGFALLASSTLLIVLLGESTALYARLANAILLLRRERADRLMSIEAATSAIVHEVRQPLTAIAMQSRAA